MKQYPDFESAIKAIMNDMQHMSQLVHTDMWQGVNISSKPEMATYELLHRSFQVPLWVEDLSYLAKDIRPNLPWADDHFKERVCGFPINPGVEWANWPYGKSAEKFLDENGRFNHNYMERYWPKFAGKLGTTETPEEAMFNAQGRIENHGLDPHHGIYNEYGDLRDLIHQLNEDPTTRQAYLPIFFPEDTGGAYGGRVPCSIGYHFILRHGFLHITYQLRSCDLVRHFRDDIYLTVRLLLWVLDELRKLDPQWKQVSPGLFTMHITSLHMFKADYVPTFGSPRKD